MPRFFDLTSGPSKSNAAVTAFSPHTHVGVPLGWLGQQSASVKLESKYSNIAADLIGDNSPFTDLRVIQACAIASAKSWRLSKCYANSSLSTTDLELLQLASHLFCKWLHTAANALTLGGFINSLTAGWNQMTDPDKVLHRTEICEVLNSGVNGIHYDVNRKEEFQDAGLSGFHFVAAVAAMVNGVLGVDGAPPQLANAWVPLTEATLEAAMVVHGNWTKESQFFGSKVFKEARVNATTYRTRYASAVMLFISSFVKTGEPTTTWVTKRAGSLEEGMSITAGSIELSSAIFPVFRDLVDFHALSLDNIHGALSVMAEHATTMGADRIKWMVDQAAYTNYTITTTLVSVLNSYDFLPLGMLFGQVPNELASFLKSAVHIYLFPYAGLKKVKFPATGYPTIASTVRGLCEAVGISTMSRYKGTFTGADMVKRDSIIATFNNIRVDAIAGDATAAILSTMMAGLAPTVTSVRGTTTVTFAVAAVGAVMPANWDQDLWNLTRSQTPTSFEVSTKALYQLIKTREIASPNTHMSIKELYLLIDLLDAGFKVSPCDANYAVPTFRRNVPANGPLHDYVTRVTIAELSP